VDELRGLFAAKFHKISNKPDSFCIWRQDLTILIVDMDQIGTGDLAKVSDDLISKSDIQS
jgi:hypothetical protein